MSNPRTRINLALLALVLVLGALALWGPAPKDAGPKENPPLTPMRADQVHHVTIERPGLKGSIRLTRADDDRWTVTLPDREAPLPADTFKATRLAELAEARVYDRFPAGGDLAAYGLDAPRATVTLNAVTLRFGATEPLRHRRYVIADGYVHLIDDRYFDAIANTPANWVDKALLPGAPALAAIRLPGLTVHRGEEGWTMEPARSDLSADALQAFVDAWRHARALTVKLPDEAPSAQGEVTLVLADGGERAFQIVQRQPRLQLWDSERQVLYEFAAYTSERLLDPSRHEPQDEEETTDGTGGA